MQNNYSGNDVKKKREIYIITVKKIFAILYHTKPMIIVPGSILSN